MRLALAQALLSRADCLLLDEPTNHLDLAGVLWLQHFLNTQLNPDCMLVMISHDKAFVDAVVTDIIEIRRQTIEQGPGNFTGWQQRRAQERETISSLVEANEKERKRTKDMIQKMRQNAGSSKKEADPNKLRQAKQRETQLYGKKGANGEEKTYGRLELSEYNGKVVDIKALAADKLSQEEKTKIKLPEVGKLSGNLLQLEGANFRIEEAKRTILHNVKLTLEPESRVAVVGTNGAGKTTLLRWLEGAQWPSGSNARRHPKMKVAHVSQHHLERLEEHLMDNSLEYMRSVLPPLEPGSILMLHYVMFPRKRPSMVIWPTLGLGELPGKSLEPYLVVKKLAWLWQRKSGTSRTCCFWTSQPIIWMWRRWMLSLMP